MISSLLSIALPIGTAVWFFFTARKTDKNPWLWALLGFICFQASYSILVQIIILPMSLFVPSTHGNQGLNTLSWVLVVGLALASAAFVRAKYLKPGSKDQD